MKVLTGFLKGRLIQLPDSPNLRPTSDLVRKAIFDTLQGVVEGKTVLDLFSGTGALGFEALSLGAKEVLWVEADRPQAEAIEESIRQLGVEEAGRVFQQDVFKALESLGRQGRVFDIVFLDPPYHQGFGQKALRRVSELGLCKSGGFAVLETHKTEDPLEQLGVFKCLKTKKHGDTKISFYRAG